MLRILLAGASLYAQVPRCIRHVRGIIATTNPARSPPRVRSVTDAAVPPILFNHAHEPLTRCTRDFKDLDNGLQYKDAKVGAGRAASEGDRVVFDWEGYTIGENEKALALSKRNLTRAGTGMVGDRMYGLWGGAGSSGGSLSPTPDDECAIRTPPSRPSGRCFREEILSLCVF